MKLLDSIEQISMKPSNSHNYLVTLLSRVSPHNVSQKKKKDLKQEASQ